MAAKLVILGILFLTSFILKLRAAYVAKLEALGILFLTLRILVLRVVAMLVISGILFSMYSILSFYTCFF